MTDVTNLNGKFRLSMVGDFVPNYESYEEACHEGECSAEHMVITETGK